MSLGRVPGGYWHTRGSGAQPAVSMVSCRAAVIRRGCPLWYIVSIRVVLAARPPTMTSA